jgi:hypothetical protein
MPSFQQMGHNSHNLLTEQDLNAYRGAVLSPVNYEENQIINLIRTHASEQFEMILDPQLYYPNTERGSLPGWSYFPSDFDTADQSSPDWWQIIVSRLSDVVIRIRPTSVCSPAIVPRVYSPDYFLLNRDIANNLNLNVQGESIEVLQTLLVRFDWLSQQPISSEIASIATSSTLDRIYLVFITDLNPRRELQYTDNLIGAMRLISLLEQAGVKVLVGFASSDLVLWKAAGASDCATGKFFNLRRFTPSRWEEPSEGGGQLSYWFEESLLAFLRESDLIRVRRAGLLSSASLSNPYSQRILDILDQKTGKPWLGLCWRQYMFWFAEYEARTSVHSSDADSILISAEQTWSILEAKQILMEERQNDGSWLRAWRRALLEWLPL